MDFDDRQRFVIIRRPEIGLPADSVKWCAGVSGNAGVARRPFLNDF
jgi:hypothetical protein